MIPVKDEQVEEKEPCVDEQVNTADAKQDNMYEYLTNRKNIFNFTLGHTVRKSLLLQTKPLRPK